MAAVVAVLLLALALVLGLATVAAAAGRAATAADLAALAAADTARGLRPGEPCAVAAATAQRNGALLDRCEQSGDGGNIVDVWTSTPFGSGWQWLDGVGIAATGRARAGPPPRPWIPQPRPPQALASQAAT
ncbi:Rv3654c family TadE-like protein [Zafaria cholistanensis]|uniref:Rv3654c family TadE-like protein n=1 Tax=Zafaria cholistanensis TaxID=1682741 RepID=UPI0021F20E53|nr:Rv3654c family TadE-like protein [Zafaria cholistanensis]